MRQLSVAGLVLLLLIGFIGCNKDNQLIDSDKLCPHLNIENINKIIPIINDYLVSLLSSNSSAEDEQNIQALTKWLKSSSCIIDARIICVSCIFTLPTQSEVSFTFKEGEATYEVTLDIIMTEPLKAAICKIQEVSNETNVSLKNTEVYNRTFVLGDEEGASISVQAQHYETSELIRNESTNMNVEYRYKPTSGFVGNDFVILEIYYNKAGEHSSAYTEIEKINFTITN